MNRYRHLKFFLVLLLTVCFLSSCSGIVSNIKTTDNTSLKTAEPTPADSRISGDNTDSRTPGNYYVVDAGGKEGVVDEQGRTILPEKFSRVEILRYEGGPPVFLASDGFAHIDGQGDSNGGIYDASGKLLAPGDYRDGSPINEKLIQVCKNSGSFGVLSFSGKAVVPCEYSRIYVCGGEIAAVIGIDSDLVHTFYVYDTEGNLLRSKELRIRLKDYDGFAPSGKDIITMDDSGRYGLMNTSFENVLPPECSDITPAGDNAYIVTNDAEVRVVDAEGNAILPGSFTSIQMNTDDNGNFTGFSAIAKDGAYVFDTKGKEIFHTDKYPFVLNDNGKFIALDGSGKMRALGEKGNDITPAGDYIYWNAGCSVYVSGTFTATDSDTLQETDCCYNEDGVRLPLPKQGAITPVSQDRFIVSVQYKDKALYGLYDRSGKELLPVKYGSLLDSNDMLIFSETDGFGVEHSGVMDTNGNIIIPAGFDSLYGGAGGDLLYARYGSVYGLIDLKGNWVFKASDYDSLMD